MIGIGLFHHMLSNYRHFDQSSGVRSTSGTQTITIGFKPIVSIVFGRDATSANPNLSWGIVFHNVSPTEQGCLYMGDNAAFVYDASGYAVNIRRTAVNHLRGEFDTQTSSGFDITWTLTGAVSLYWRAFTFG